MGFGFRGLGWGFMGQGMGVWSLGTRNSEVGVEAHTLTWLISSPRSCAAG